MGVKTDNSPVDVWLSKMEATIENIASLVATGTLVVNQLMERKVAVALTTNVVEEPKWTTMMGKSVR
jgi:hypothetical protein